jgi:ABC-type multidrug transport system fused ATPase/permease subunit
LLVGGYLLYGGIQVVDGVTDLASFLSTITIFRSLDSEFQVAYQQALKITAAYASIAQLTIYMNLPVDVPQRLDTMRARRKLGRELRAEQLAKLDDNENMLSPDDVPADVLPIRMSNVHFKYEEPMDMKAEARAAARERERKASFSWPSLHVLKKIMSVKLESVTPDESSTQSGFLSHKENKSSQLDLEEAKEVEHEMAVNIEQDTNDTSNGQHPLWKKVAFHVREGTIDPDEIEGDLHGVELELEQGKMVAVVGPPSQGKATILRLLAGQIFPDLSVQANRTAPQLFVPPHLRIVQIQENPLILGPEESIFDNLIFGVKQSPSMDLVALETRARAIMAKLGFKKVLLENYFVEKGFLGVNGTRITRSDRQLIALGRAFVMNPEVIIAHKPTALLDDSHTSKVLEMFREFTDNRGVLMPDDEPLIRRRKRTAIFTAKNASIASLSHVVYKVLLMPLFREIHTALI